MKASGYKFFFAAVCISSAIPGYSQAKLITNPNPYSFQYGFSLKANVELSLNSYKPKPICKISGNFGVGSNFLSSWLYPSFNLEVDLYNGGLGSKNENKFFNAPWDLDITTAFTLTGGTKNHFTNSRTNTLKHRNIPLYYFADFVYPALQNSFDFSISVGTNIIFTPANKEKKNQRIGFINGHFDRLQVSYYNDGGVPISDTYLGDRRDRNYTGGGVISYHGESNSALSLIELSYHKFTGYTKNAFEISNLLFLNYMNYHSPEQRKYNKSLWSLNIGNPSNGWGIKLSSYNKINWDMQHYIHWGLFNTYHMVPYRSYWAISGSFYNSSTKIGIQ